MGKIDLKRELPGYTARRGRFDLIEVPPLQYLMIDGHGDPNTVRTYREAIETLYPVAFRLKFFSKRELDRDYTVMPLEGLWWADDLASFTSARDKSQWDWTVMILTPSWLGAAEVGAVVDGLRGAAGSAGVPPMLDALRLEGLDEGLCAQTLHVGSYDDEGPVLARLHDEFLPEHGLVPTGTHHEIYLSDPRRAAPEKLRTIVRQPVRRGKISGSRAAATTPG